MTRNHRTHNVLIAGVGALSLLAAACGDDDGASGESETETTEAASEVPATDAPTTEAPTTEAPDGGGEITGTAPAEGQMMAPSGPACGSIPKSGPGSFDGMADDPAATAASNNPALSTLVSAVGQANLVDTLNGEGPFTIFAPVNEAFEAIPPKDLNAVMADTEALTNILTYHVVAGQSMSSADLAEAGSVKTVQGGTLTIGMDGDAPVVNDGAASVICADVPVGNGTVHIIDSVLMPPS